MDREWAIVRDAFHDCALKTYYITPDFLLTQLYDAGFGSVRIFMAKTQKEINLKTFRNSGDEWIYILAGA
jgi:hypothetical protein